MQTKVAFQYMKTSSPKKQRLQLQIIMSPTLKKTPVTPTKLSNTEFTYRDKYLRLIKWIFKTVVLKNNIVAIYGMYWVVVDLLNANLIL